MNSFPSTRHRKLITLLFESWLGLASIITIFIIFLIFAFIIRESYPFITSGVDIGDVFTSTSWVPSEDLYGVLPLMIGTLAVVAGSLLIAIPVALFSALSLVFYLKQPWKGIFQLICEAAAGTPSVVVGLFGLFILVPRLAGFFPPGFGLAAASIVLSFLLMPALIISTFEILSIDLDDILKVARSLRIGIPTLFFKVIGPAKIRPFLRAVGIATGRALGETLAILMVAGNVVALPAGLFEPFRTLNAAIALEMPYAQGVHRSSLFFLGFITLGGVLGLRLVLWRRRQS